MQGLLFIFLALCLVAALAKIKGKNQHETLGVLLLDAITFPKVVPHPKLNVLVMVTNKAQIGEFCIRMCIQALVDAGRL